MEGAEENTSNLNQNNWCPGRDSRKAPLEYDSECYS
jgi:hypothetical protein